MVGKFTDLVEYRKHFCELRKIDQDQLAPLTPKMYCLFWPWNVGLAL